MDNETMSGSSNTGTRDVTYDLTAVLYHALQGVENCRTYMDDAEGKQDHRQFFQMALDSQRQLAEQAKRLLHDCLMEETGGGSMSGQGTSGARDESAFRFASSETQGGSDQFAQGGGVDREDGSALGSGQHTGALHNDPGAAEFGQSALGQGQRHDEMRTGGGGTTSF